jgi:ChpA-C
MRRILAVAALAGAAILTATACGDPAQAAPAGCHRVHQSSGPNYGILNGTQVNLPVDVGVNLVGNALGVLGFANAAGGYTSTSACGN